MIWMPALLTALSLLCVGLMLDLRARKQREQLRHTLAIQMEYVLTLIQGVQKHRGLSGQASATALRQREQLALQLDRQWTDWSSIIGSTAMATSEAATPQTAISWQGLRARPTDFNYHCLLIDQLLTALTLLEVSLLSIDAKTAGSKSVAGKSVDGKAQHQSFLSLAGRCREIEDLGRVRGLSVRAATHKRCPIDMEVPLRYLCRRLAAGTLQTGDPAIGMALREIQQKLLDSTHVAMTPERCFELLTPSIDRALDNLRRSLPAGRAASIPSNSVRHTAERGVLAVGI